MADYAIIIGLTKYPGLGDPQLEGPENDALAFKEWVLDKTGGNVTPENVKTILSSDYYEPHDEQQNVFAARPAILDVIAAFQNLRDISAKNLKNRKGPKVGSRIYLFMSGHGIAPTPYGNKVTKESALLMSNVDPANIEAPLYHLPGVYAANWLCENEYFDEVYLFMDCCRDMTTVPSLHMFFPPKGNYDNAIRFYAFATKWSRRARERKIDDKVQGVFTKTLLKGLKGAAADPDPTNLTRGVITGASLSSYLYQNMKEFIDPLFLNDPQIQQPDIEFFPKAQGGKDIRIVSTPLRRFPVKIRVPMGAKGCLTILYDGKVQVEKIPINSSPIELQIGLPRGKYLATLAINNSAKFSLFDVKGIEDEPLKEGLVEFKDFN